MSVKIFSKKVYYKEDISQRRYITTSRGIYLVAVNEQTLKSRGNSKKDILQRRYITKKICYKELYYKEDNYITTSRGNSKKIYFSWHVKVRMRVLNSRAASQAR
jgi:hypothetical protein